MNTAPLDGGARKFNLPLSYGASQVITDDMHRFAVGVGVAEESSKNAKLCTGVAGARLAITLRRLAVWTPRYNETCP